MPHSRRILAFDAAGSACSAALWCDHRIVARRFEAMRRGQSERLVPMIQEVMAEAGLDFHDLDCLAVTVGPGGFTGVRLGLATARGLALACRRPVVGITNLRAVAAAVPSAERQDQKIAVLLDAKRSDLYFQVFAADLSPVTQPACAAPAELVSLLPDGPVIMVGSAVDQASAIDESRARRFTRPPAYGETDASQVAALAAESDLPPAGSPPPQPLYLRPPDVTLPKARRGAP